MNNLRLTLKDIPQILKEYKNRGITVEKYKGYINSRKAFYLDSKLFTDYEILTQYEFGIM